MKKLFILPLLLAVGIFLSGCEDTSTDPIVTVVKGSVYVQTTPVGAQIWINNVNSGKVTPDTIKNLDSGNVVITLKLATFKDTTFTVQILPNQVRSVAITMKADINAVKFGPVRIWETAGTTAAQPSGLILATGVAASSGDNATDIYYSSTGWIVRTGTVKTTWFKVGNGSTNLNDGVSSTIQDNSWANNMIDRATNGYYFIKTQEGNYVKILITNFSPGGVGNPAWVEVTYWYNNTVGDLRFPTN